MVFMVKIIYFNWKLKCSQANGVAIKMFKTRGHYKSDGD